MKRKADYVLFFIFIVIILTFYAVFIIGQKPASEFENRELSQLPIFELGDFSNKTFQDNLENAISDQIIIAKEVKKKALEIRKDIINLMNNIILKIRNNQNGRYYVSIAENTYKINNEDYLLNKEKIDVYNPKSINYFNKIEGVPKYLYFIEIDRSKVFYNEQHKDTQYEKISKAIEVADKANFELPNYESHKEYFYKTDHHWNYKGQYEGYKEITKLLGIPESEQIKVTEEKEYEIYFWGSKSRNATEYDIKEKFRVFKYNNQKPEETYIDGKACVYGKSAEYDKGQYENKQYTNHYGDYYGWDNGEIIYDYKIPEKENLLIISDSFSNAVNEIIASHFNKTHVIDLRQNKEFEPNEYIRKNEIDKVLILGDITLFSNSYFQNYNLDNY